MRLFIVIVVAVVSIANAQFVDVPSGGVSSKPWTGPFADHQIGVHPGDTPEVAAAKAQHLKAYRDVLAVLPELPLEERHIRDGLPLQKLNELYVQQHVQPAQVVPSVPVSSRRVPQTLDSLVSVVSSTAPTVLAEEVPRSPIGEVPEVHAARVAHLKAVQEARAALPPL